MNKNSILALDVGSENIKALVAASGGSGRIDLVSGLTRPSDGIRRGVIVDMNAAAAEINSILQFAKEISKDSIRNVYLNIGGADVKSQVSKGIAAVSRASLEIHRDDIDRVLEASQAVNLPSNRQIIHTINREFIVDGISVENPLGMNGARLEVVSYVIDAFRPNVKNLMKCVEIAGGSVAALIFSPLASAASVLTKSQKELGSVLIDIGYGTTGIAVYEEGKLMHTKIIPIGAGHVTNDLAVALKIPVDVAERIKVSYGYAVALGVPAKESVDLNKIDSALKGNPSRKYISQIVESRLSEICELVNDELATIDRVAKLPGGAVIVGGGAKLPGIVELFKSELKVTAKIGLPRPNLFEAESSAIGKFIESPEYACVLGLAAWPYDTGALEHERLAKGELLGYIRRVTNYLKNFLP